MKTNERQEGSWLIWGLGLFVSALFASSVVMAVTIEPPQFSGYGIEQYRQVADADPLGGASQPDEASPVEAGASSPEAPGATFLADAGHIVRISGR